jgi:MOSC domain-containing protein YiiM
VLLYAASNYDLWHEELGRSDMSAGGFGENFTVEGMNEENVSVGDIYALGEAQIQVTGPRYPCAKIEKRWHMPGLTAHVSQTGRTGWYCRVLREGQIEVGMPILLVERPYPRWTMALINSFSNGSNKDVALAQELAACPLLEEWWGKLIVKRAKSKK